MKSCHGVQGNTSSLRVLRYGRRFPCPEKEHEASAVTLTALYYTLGLAIATEEWCWILGSGSTGTKSRRTISAGEQAVGFKRAKTSNPCLTQENVRTLLGTDEFKLEKLKYYAMEIRYNAENYPKMEVLRS